LSGFGLDHELGLVLVLVDVVDDRTGGRSEDGARR